MEDKKQFCPIWGVTVARIQQLHDMDGCLIEGSPRTGGDYKITIVSGGRKATRCEARARRTTGRAQRAPCRTQASRKPVTALVFA